jgi:hypothetical protein
MRKSFKSVPGTATATPAIGRQLSIRFDSILLGTMKAPEREKVLARLANLLAQAAGVSTKESVDDER